MRKHHRWLAAAALVLALAWIAWNSLLVESDVAGVADDLPAASGSPPSRAP